VVVRQGQIVLCAFHPELTDDSRLHALLMALATSSRDRSARDTHRTTSGEA
jgi:glutamine amidotransferase PdxT